MSEREGYPTMEEIGRDCAALRIVSPAYAGRDGELTAVLQYVFQAVVLSQCGKEEMAKQLREIAVEEMHHLGIMGTLLCKLGAPPLFTACPPYPVGFYSASCVNYAREPAAMLEADLHAERLAIDGYSRMLCRLENRAVCAVIERLRADEYGHLRRFEEMYRALG